MRLKIFLLFLPLILTVKAVANAQSRQDWSLPSQNVRSPIHRVPRPLPRPSVVRPIEPVEPEAVTEAMIQEIEPTEAVPPPLPQPVPSRPLFPPRAPFRLPARPAAPTPGPIETQPPAEPEVLVTDAPLPETSWAPVKPPSRFPLAPRPIPRPSYVGPVRTPEAPTVNPEPAPAPKLVPEADPEPVPIEEPIPVPEPQMDPIPEPQTPEPEPIPPPPPTPARPPYRPPGPTPKPKPHSSKQPRPRPRPASSTPRPHSIAPGPYTTDGEPIDYKCKEDGYYSIPNQCDTFIECKRGAALKYICPDGLNFNSKTMYPEYPCAYPSEVKCNSLERAREPQPTSQCPHQYGFFSMNDGDCSQYLMCQEGLATVMRCPPGLVFNQEQSACDWPGNVPSCTPSVFRGFTCPPAPVDEYGAPYDWIYKYKYGKSCKEYIACQRGHPRLLSCDPGLAFDEVSEACIDDDYVPGCGRQDRNV